MFFYKVSDINHRIKRNPQEFISSSENDFQQKIRQAAQEVLSRSTDHPIILLSGPSGSGKTTSALKIEYYLDSWGRETHTISMDDYFFGSDEGDFPLDPEGRIDLESPLRLNVSLLQEHLEKLAQCVPISLPKFDFSTQRRTDNAMPLHRRPGELVIFEGIHALNPEVVGRALDFSTGIYVSVRTRIMGENGLVLHPEKLRLMRRLLRDSLYRGQSYSETISRLYSVSRGEDLYIMPHKHHACISIDTFLPYEAAIYCGELRKGVVSLPAELLEHEGITDILELFKQIELLPMKAVPPDSLLREFIGEG